MEALILTEWVTSVYLIDESRFYLIYHKKLGKWLPVGGHIEPGETPVEAAHREALEESGFEIELFSAPSLFIDEPNAKSVLPPFHMLIEEIPPFKEMPAHRHIDCIYVGRPTAQKTIGSERGRFWTLEEIDQLPPSELFNDTKQMLHFLAAAFYSPASAISSF